MLKHVRPPRTLVEAAPIVLFVIASVLFARECFTYVTGSEPFAPVRALPLSIEPDRAHAGETVTLINGLCIDSGEPITAQVYVGIQEAHGRPLFSTIKFDLVGTDTQEGRKRVVLQRGCVDERLDTALPDYIPPGRWILVAHVVVVGPSGEVQDLTHQSEPFDIIGP